MNISDLQNSMLNAKHNSLPNKHNKVMITHTQNAWHFSLMKYFPLFYYGIKHVFFVRDIFVGLENNLSF